jgi:four helix bundle protein
MGNNIFGERTDAEMWPGEPLIPKHGGYRRLKSFQLARLIYDVTVLFCDRFIDKRSRTHDQMVQAARSGVQNIAEGSQASGTSKKTELKLTNVARASLEELRLDYEDFLRQRKLELYTPNNPVLTRFKAKRCATLEQFRNWISEEMVFNTDKHGHIRTGSECSAISLEPLLLFAQTTDRGSS